MNPATLYNNDTLTNVPVEAPVERRFYPYADNGGYGHYFFFYQGVPK
jgi:hypothetical protein